MKKFHFLLVCLFVTVNSNAHTSAINSTTSTAADFSTQTAPVPSKIQPKPVAQAGLSKIKRGVVKEMKATSAFVQQQAAKAETSDGRLIALVLIGLVVLQLRRKHKSLPQRRIVPYG